MTVSGKWRLDRSAVWRCHLAAADRRPEAVRFFQGMSLVIGRDEREVRRKEEDSLPERIAEAVTYGHSRAALPEPGRSVADVIRDETGVIVRVSPTNLVLSPPLIMTEDEAATAVAAVASVLRRVRTDGTLA